MFALPHGIEILEADAVVVLSNADQFGLRVLERGDPAGERRQLHQDDVAGAHQHAGDEIDALLRAARDDQVLERGVDATSPRETRVPARAAA